MRLKRQSWNSAAAKRLRSLAPSKDVATAVTIVAGRLLDGVALSPTDLPAVAAKVGVEQCNAESQLPVSAALRKIGNRYTIVYAPRLPTGRRRFSIAHEIAHLVVGNGRTSLNHSNWEVERLCDMLATEFLMPRMLFLDRAGRRPGIDTLFQLSAEFEVSLTAAALRICELTGACAFESSADSIVWGRGPVRDTMPELNTIIQSALAGQKVQERVRLYRGGGLDKLWSIEGARIGRGQRAIFVMWPSSSDGREIVIDTTEPADAHAQHVVRSKQAHAPERDSIDLPPTSTAL